MVLVIKMTDATKKKLKEMGDVIRALRKKTGFSQEKFATRVGVDRKHYSAIETGKQNMTIWTLMKVAKALDVTPSFLVKETIKDENIRGKHEKNRQTNKRNTA